MLNRGCAGPKMIQKARTTRFLLLPLLCVVLCGCTFAFADWASGSKKGNFIIDESIDTQLSSHWRRFVSEIGADSASPFVFYPISCQKITRAVVSGRLFASVRVSTCTQMRKSDNTKLAAFGSGLSPSPHSWRY